MSICEHDLVCDNGAVTFNSYARIRTHQRAVFRRAVAVSCLVHLAAFSALAMRQHLQHRAQAAGRQAPIQIIMTSEATWSNPTQQITLDTPEEQTVVIRPTQARVARRRYIQIPDPHEVLSSTEVNVLPPHSSLARATPSTAPSLELLHTRPRRPNHLTPNTSNTVPPIIQPGAVTEAATAVDLAGNPPPAYPIDAQRRRWQGTVLLRLFIDAEGGMTRVELVRSSGYEVLDNAAVTAVRQWKATPATRGGKPIPSVEVLPVKFQL